MNRLIVGALVLVLSGWGAPSEAAKQAPAGNAGTTEAVKQARVIDIISDWDACKEGELVSVTGTAWLNDDGRLQVRHDFNSKQKYRSIAEEVNDLGMAVTCLDNPPPAFVPGQVTLVGTVAAKLVSGKPNQGQLGVRQLLLEHVKVEQVASAAATGKATR